MSITLTLALCEGRHALPADVQGFVIPERMTTFLPQMRQEALESYIFARMWDKCHAAGATHPVYTDDELAYIITAGKVSLRLYVTGYTPALISTLNVCKQEGIAVTLLHYDRESGEYWAQSVT